jgi:hypothetical protein
MLTHSATHQPSVRKALACFWQSFTTWFRSSFETYPQITQLTLISENYVVHMPCKCFIAATFPWGVVGWVCSAAESNLRVIEVQLVLARLTFSMKLGERLFLGLRVDCRGCCLWLVGIEVCVVCSCGCVLLMLLYTAFATSGGLFLQTAQYLQ